VGAAAAAAFMAGCGPGRESRRPAPAAGESDAPPSIPPPIPAETYARRRADVAARMREEKIDLLVVSRGASLAYLTGVFLPENNRLLAWMLEDDGTCRGLAPAAERQDLVRSGLPGQLRTWEEGEDPVSLLAGIIERARPSPRIAVDGPPDLAPTGRLARQVRTSKITAAAPLLSPLRIRKDPGEVALIQAGAEITLRTILQVMREAREGTTEKEILGRAVETARAMGTALEGAVRFGANGADPPAGAGAARLRRPDVIVFSLSARVRGYHSRTSRTFAYSEPSPRYRQIYRVVRQAQEEAIRAARPGIPAGKVHEAARSALHRDGLGKFFTGGAGHGVGLEEFEEPILASGSNLILEEGMVVAVGPGIYLPGEYGVRLEDVVLVTPTGPRLLPSPSDAAP
jgi:Xaa-Pro dipeptidase